MKPLSGAKTNNLAKPELNSRTSTTASKKSEDKCMPCNTTSAIKMKLLVAPSQQRMRSFNASFMGYQGHDRATQARHDTPQVNQALLIVTLQGTKMDPSFTP